MGEDRQRLRQSLEDLRLQLATADLPDQATRLRLEQTIVEIESALGPGQALVPVRPVNSSLVRRLSDATDEFEASHPTLSGAIGSVIDALSRMGI
jgi:hypothetical protein